MNRHLLLMRHAKSDWGDDALADFDRPLSARGQRDAPRMANWLANQAFVPELIISSPAERARTTALALARALNISGCDIIFEQAIYGASVQALLYALSSHCEQFSRVILVGHNPGLEELLMYLSGGRIPDTQGHKLMPTGAIAHLLCEQPFSELGHKRAVCDVLQRPRSLP